MYSFILFLLLIGICLYKVVPKDYGPNRDTYNKGYCIDKEEIDKICSRILWANNYPNRLCYVYRYLFYSSVIVFMIFLIIHNHISFSPIEYIQCVFISFILLYAFSQFSYYHSDKFAHYAIYENINNIMKKLKLKKRKLDIVRHISVPSECYNY
jgi:hypothetical protein